MLTAFFNNEGVVAFPPRIQILIVVHHEFLPAIQTVNGPLYVQVLKRLKEAIQRKRPAKWLGGWSLHHDNAPSQASIVVQTRLTEKDKPLLHQPAYFQNLTSSDYLKMKMAFEGNRFDTIEDIKTNATVEQRKIPKHDFHRCF